MMKKNKIEVIEILSDEEENNIRKQLIDYEIKDHHYQRSLLCNSFDMIVIVMKRHMGSFKDDSDEVIRHRIADYFAAYHGIYNKTNFSSRSIIPQHLLTNDELRDYLYLVNKKKKQRMVSGYQRNKVRYERRLERHINEEKKSKSRERSRQKKFKKRESSFVVEKNEGSYQKSSSFSIEQSLMKIELDGLSFPIESYNETERDDGELMQKMKKSEE